MGYRGRFPLQNSFVWARLSAFGRQGKRKRLKWGMKVSPPFSLQAIRSAVSGPRAISGLMDRRTFLRGGLATAGAMALYSGEGERHWIEIVSRSIVIANLPTAFEGLRIVQVSDIHFEDFTEPFFLRHAIERINALNPDVVALTGDFVSLGFHGEQYVRRATWACAELLGELRCARRFGVLGNHDYAPGVHAVTEAMSSRGIQMLNNRAVSLELGGERIWFVGMIDPHMSNPQPELYMPSGYRSCDDEPVIFLAHSPDYADELRRRVGDRHIRLVLSGHTHGGQIVFPLVGPLHLPTNGKKYVHGHFQLGNMQLYVNRGLGAVGVPFRMNCPPEITVLTLTRAQAPHLPAHEAPEKGGRMLL